VQRGPLVWPITVGQGPAGDDLPRGRGEMTTDRADRCGCHPIPTSNALVNPPHNPLWVALVHTTSTALTPCGPLRRESRSCSWLHDRGRLRRTAELPWHEAPTSRDRSLWGLPHL